MNDTLRNFLIWPLFGLGVFSIIIIGEAACSVIKPVREYHNCQARLCYAWVGNQLTGHDKSYPCYVCDEGIKGLEDK